MPAGVLILCSGGHIGTAVLTITASGLELEDDAISAEGTDTLLLAAGTTFSVVHGTTSGAVVVEIDAAGTRVTDSVITLTASDQVIVEAVSGAVIRNTATFQDGLVLTGGIVDIDAVATVDIDATTTTTVSGDTSVSLQHASVDVLVVSSTGISVLDDFITMRATTDMDITVENSFTLTREHCAGCPLDTPSIEIDNVGVTLRDSSIVLTASDIISITGGTLGTHFQDNVIMYEGLQVVCSVLPGGCGVVDIATEALTVNSNANAEIDFSTIFLLQHNDVNIMAAGTYNTQLWGDSSPGTDVDGTLMIDANVDVRTATTLTLQSAGTFTLLHGTDVTMRTDSTGTLLHDSNIVVVGDAGIQVTGGATGTLYHDDLTVSSQVFVETHAPTSGMYTGVSFAAFDFSNAGADTSLNEDLVVVVDGGAPQTITLATSIQTAAAAASALAGLTGAMASEDFGYVVITSASTGASSTVAIDPSSGTNAAALFGASTAVDGHVAATSGAYTAASFVGFDFSNGGGDTSLNENMIVTVDGSDQTIALVDSIATPADAVTALAGLTGATASLVAGRVVITSGAGPHKHGLQSNTMALITSGCDAMHFSSIKWP